MIENFYGYSRRHLVYLFKKTFQEEFDDPNESFELFLLSLISKDNIAHILLMGKNYYYKNINNFK